MTIAENLIADLNRIVPIPSIGALLNHAGDLKTSAETIADMLREVGCPDVQVIDGPCAPAIIARFPAPEGKPTVCFYSHHDVQPIGDRGVWVHDPLTVTPAGDRLFGRGTADDKGGVACHVETLRAFDGKPPIGVTVFIEGEEEIGSPHILDFIRDHVDEIRADAYVILDAGNWKVGEPAFTTSLRGVCDCVVKVSTLDHALHSGQFGGVAPDALTALCRLMASLHDAEGNVAIAGLTTAVDFDVDYDSEQFRADAGLLDGVSQLGSGPIAERLWAKPSVSVIGIDAVSVEESSNTLLPSATARISLRVPPGMEAAAALEALVAHLTSHAPWGAHVEVERGAAGNPGQVPIDGPLVQAGMAAYTQAFGVAPVAIGQGGAIPLVGELHEAFPAAEFLVTGIADPDSRMHSPNESVSLSDLVKTVEAQVGFLQRAASLTD
ncbi:MAG: M20/M25/M40 family metallo-hydrolase [Propionibacteriaceae bacterium]|jgi:acetylornithine deacetylase/succinyl-diaminopimelate desuccinylase-like protein|nr:M20/M25/M40 family metallo-hydrolase [Propionibacteriaceae bacterium]